MATSANANDRRDEIIATGARLFARNGFGQPHSFGDVGCCEGRGPSKVGAQVTHRRGRRQQCRRSGSELMGNAQRVKDFGRKALMTEGG